MEWAYAGAATVQKDVEDIILKALDLLRPSESYQSFRDGARIPVLPRNSQRLDETNQPHTPAHEFTRLTFAEAIAKYGSDKPDLRIPGTVCQSLNQSQYSTNENRLQQYRSRRAPSTLLV